MNGIVSQLNVEEGERVVGTIQMTGTELARIADLSRMEVRVEVSENDIPRVNLGDPVEIKVDAFLDRVFTGRVTEISSSANNLTNAAGVQVLTTDQVTNFAVTIEIEPSSYKDLVTASRPYPFRPGMSASVDIMTEVVENAVAAPIASVTAREKENLRKKASAKTVSNDGEEEELIDLNDLEEVVWVVTAADTVERRVVKTGIQDRENIQITQGLKVGERIVTGPYSAVARRLDQGDKVYQQEEKKESKDKDEDSEDE